MERISLEMLRFGCAEMIEVLELEKPEWNTIYSININTVGISLQGRFAPSVITGLLVRFPGAEFRISETTGYLETKVSIPLDKSGNVVLISIILT